jgi:hypothetical protein
VLKGTLDDFTLSDIFRLTALAKKTGRLEVERRTGSGRVYFRDGEVYHAESTKSQELLGRKLTRSGRVTEKQLRRAVIDQEQTGRRLGDILIEQGVVEEEQIEWAVRSQIEDGVFDLLRWDLGAFVWEPDVETEVEVPLTVSVENLIIEASRRLDEISQIRKKIPSADVVLAMSPRPPDGAHQINITSEEWQVLVLVDGRRTVEDIATSTGAEAYQTTRLLFGLMNAGLIEHKQVPVGITDEPEAYSPSSSREQRRGAGSAGPQNSNGAGSAGPQNSNGAGSAGPQNSNGADSAGPQNANRWHRSDDPDSNVVELQQEVDDEVADAHGADRRKAAVTPPAPPLAPRPPDEDRRAVPRGVREPRRREARGEPGTSESEPDANPKRFRGPRVDRSAVVRELAGLFSEGNKPRPRAVPSAEADRNTDKPPAPTEKRRVEDDDQVDGKLIGRMIDGVKEL